ncbi:MAG: outer membrane lipoprotein carrier protein LolA [bacterium]|nr:outer membrane lipoprotein carrier protein LolA [bacterium]
MARSLSSALLVLLAFAVLIPEAPVRAASPLPGRETPLDLETLLADFARIPGLAARFHEEKHLALLVEPLETRGTIYFAPPGRLARHTEAPLRSTLLLDGEQLRYASDEDRGALDLAVHPMLGVFVDSFRMLLRGDLPGLQMNFVLELRSVGKPEGRRWELVLEPRAEALKRSLRVLQIFGQGRSVSRLRILERGGDETLMVFTDVDSQRVFTQRELDELFELPAP